MLDINQEELELLGKKNTILQVVAGSHAYGTNLPTSDWDERGIFTDEMNRIVLPFEKIEQIKYEKDDIVVYELSKYMQLLLEQNPNVIELLWTAPEDIVFKNKMGDLLLNHKKDFLSIKVKDSYVGYAKSQLGRIKGHNKWINNPQPEAEPVPKDFVSVVWNNTETKEFNKTVPFDGFCAVNLGDNHFALFKNENQQYHKNKTWSDLRGNLNPIDKDKVKEFKKLNLNPDLIVKFNEAQFDDHHKNWKMYWSWKKNRNEARSSLEESFGYDTKHAMHLIRLLRSGLDILEYGVVPVKRNDAEYLLDIRSGKFSYEDIVAESERLTNKVSEIAKKSSLPPNPNYELAKEMMMEIYYSQWKIENKPNHNNGKNFNLNKN